MRPSAGQQLDPNALVLRLQPDEGISLRFNGKVPGTSVQVRPVRMHFSYDAEFGAYTPEAYERLLLEAMAGDATLFIRRDEVETAWRIVDGIRQGWDGKPLSNREFYAGGHVGPGGRRRSAGADGPCLVRTMVVHDRQAKPRNWRGRQALEEKCIIFYLNIFGQCAVSYSRCKQKISLFV